MFPFSAYGVVGGQRKALISSKPLNLFSSLHFLKMISW